MKTDNTQDILDKIKLYASFALAEVIIGVASGVIGWNTKSENIKYSLMVLAALFIIAGCYTLFIKINKMLILAYGSPRTSAEVNEEYSSNEASEQQN
jgi:hypothetical protein